MGGISNCQTTCWHQWIKKWRKNVVFWSTHIYYSMEAPFILFKTRKSICWSGKKQNCPKSNHWGREISWRTVCIWGRLQMFYQSFRIWPWSNHSPAISMPHGCDTLRKQLVRDSQGCKLAASFNGLVFQQNVIENSHRIWSHW